jgi:N-hydroxyarylamine O-acetyltransferase
MEHSTRDDELMTAYLRRLGVEAEPPSVDALFRLHRAQLERVPYETTWLHMGEQWTVDPDAAFERVAVGSRGGYCFHVNGAFSTLLSMLGYDVTRHIGGVHGPEPVEDDLTNHLVLLVHGLPSDENPDGTWYVDGGLGDALHEPLPLVAGIYHQEPLTFSLTETPGGIGDWHFAHDPRGTFVGMNFRLPLATPADFAAKHHELSTSPESGFVKTVTVQRRYDGGVVALRALTLTVRTNDGLTTTYVTDRDGWFALLADEFDLGLDGVEPEAKDRLWASATASHEAWLARSEADGD